MFLTLVVPDKSKLVSRRRFNMFILLVGEETIYIIFTFFIQGFYEYINEASVLEYLRGFLTHEDPNVRSKTCSAVGNMCRHSSYFYASLVSFES